MIRSGYQWTVVAIAVLGLAVIAVTFGLSMLPSLTVATERGVFAGWLIAWGMVAITVVSAVVLAGYLVSTASKIRRAQ